MKNITNKNTSKNNSHPYPSDKTRWAYWMQAIEPDNAAINKAFPGFHPQWVQLSQKSNITPEHLMLLRTQLKISVEQCAAYLRTSTKDVMDWESGRKKIPFVVFEVLRLVIDTHAFKTNHPEWDGWFIGAHGELVSPDVGCCFTPGELNVMSFQRADLSWMRGEIVRLQSELNAAIEANNQLRQMFLSQGVVEELISMKNRLNALVDSVTPSNETRLQPREKIIDGTLA